MVDQAFDALPKPSDKPNESTTHTAAAQWQDPMWRCAMQAMQPQDSSKGHLPDITIDNTGGGTVNLNWSMSSIGNLTADQKATLGKDFTAIQTDLSMLGADLKGFNNYIDGLLKGSPNAGDTLPGVTPSGDVPPAVPPDATPPGDVPPAVPPDATPPGDFPPAVPPDATPPGDFPPAVPPGPNSGFQIQNGQILMNGSKLTGVAVTGEYAKQVGPDALANQIATQFPGINTVRLSTSPEGGAFTNGQQLAGGQTVDDVNATIKALNAKGIGVIVDNHGSDANTANNVSQTGNEAAWLGQITAANANNNMVMLQPLNEPIGDDAAVAAEQKTAYDAVRAAEAQTPGSVQHIVAFDLIGGGGTSALTNNAAMYDSMSNYVIDAHAYASNSANPVADFQNEIAPIANLHEANGGAVPVYSGETGNSIDGSNLDPQATPLLNNIYSTVGGIAWLYDGAATGFGSGNGADHLTDQSGNLTSYGQQIAALIAAQKGG